MKVFDAIPMNVAKDSEQYQVGTGVLLFQAYWEDVEGTLNGTLSMYASLEPADPNCKALVWSLQPDSVNNTADSVLFSITLPPNVKCWLHWQPADITGGSLTIYMNLQTKGT